MTEDSALPTGDTQLSRSPIQAIDRAVGLLTVIANAGPAGASLRELRTACQLKASTARSLLSSLVMHTLAEQDPETGTYRLGSRLLELNRAYLARSDLASVVMPTAQALWRETEETVFFSVLRNGYRTELITLPSPQLLSVNVIPPPQVSEPSSWDLHAMAVGKVFLAELEREEVEQLLRRHSLDARTPQTVTSTHELFDILAEVRRVGYATNQEEHVIGVCGVAAPVRDAYGTAVGCMCIAYPSPRASKTYDERMRRAVVAAAARISRLLGAEQETNHTKLGA